MAEGDSFNMSHVLTTNFNEGYKMAQKWHTNGILSSLTHWFLNAQNHEQHGLFSRVIKMVMMVSLFVLNKYCILNIVHKIFHQNHDQLTNY